MEAFDSYLNDLVNQNRNLFNSETNINWLHPYNSAHFQQRREELLKQLEENFLFKETKPYHKQISKGCMLCGLGTWSCLFITGKCNAGCFYCPAPQLSDETPETQGLKFDTAESYAEYIDFFKFKGVSFSGGEPLLFFDRTLQYLKQIRKKCSPSVYIWMYTNGILGDEQKFRKLAAAGIDEVRFDIGATGFKLDKLHAAKGIVPTISIEIPAIPEEKENLKQLLPEMIKAGVSNLNLHQLRLTKHNAPKLLKRDYTYIPAERPIVLESELAALEIIQYAKQNHLDIGINYCSFFYKNRFQKAGFRKQIANALAEPDEKITEKGFIRNFNENNISYKTLLLSDVPYPLAQSSELKLPHKKIFIRTEQAMLPQKLGSEQKQQINSLLNKEPEAIPSDSLSFNIWQMEYIEKGLREI